MRGFDFKFRRTPPYQKMAYLPRTHFLLRNSKMTTFTRIATNPAGMARLVTNYARIKEMQSTDLSIQKIAEIFDEDIVG